MPLIIGIVDSSPIPLHEPYDSIVALAPLVYYQFDGSSSPVVNKGSAVGKDLTTSGVVFGQPPISEVSDDTSAAFNGTTAFGQATDPVITGAAPVFSAGVWFRMTDATATFRHLIQQQDSTGNNGGFRLYLYGDGRAFIEAKTATGAADFSISMGELFPEILSGDLTLVGVTATATDGYLFVNGVQVGSFAGRLNTGQSWPATSDIYVGRDYDTTDYFKGDISDAFITNTVITADEWAALYEVARSVSRPAYDDFATAFSFDPTADTTEPFVVDNASTEAGELAELFGGGTKLTRSLWATCTPAISQSLVIASSSATAQHVIHVYSGTALDSLTLVDTVGSVVAPQLTNTKEVSLTGGTTYYLRIGNYLDDSGTISLTVGPPPPPPPNDDFVDAIEIDTTTSGSVTDGTCVNATGETGEPDNPLLPLPQYTKSVWYKFTADATGTITFTNAGTGYLFLGLEAYTGVAVNALTSAGTTTYTPGTPYATSLPLSVTNGTTYYLQAICVDGALAPDTFEFQWTDIT
jgi:hypothetical protein